MPRRSEKVLPPFAVKLKALRLASGLTQQQLAKRAGIHLGGLFKIEQGLRQPSWETVQRLANALGVDYSAFADPNLKMPAAEQAARRYGDPAKQHEAEPSAGQKQRRGRSPRSK